MQNETVRDEFETDLNCEHARKKVIEFVEYLNKTKRNKEGLARMLLFF